MRRGLKVSIDPRSCKMKGWVGTTIQSLGKGLKESIDLKGCKIKGWVGTHTQNLEKGLNESIPKRLQDEEVGGRAQTHRLWEKVKGVYGPKRLQMKGWVGTNTQTLGKYYQLAQT